MEQQNLIFVYGSLRNGHCNHHLLKDAYCFGIGSTEGSFAMYLVSGYPYVTASESRYPIVGELYGIDDDTLKLLDRMEGHPRYYERREIPVLVEEIRYIAWLYFRDPPGVLMHSGDFDKVNFGKV